MLETMLNGSLVEVSNLDAQWLLDFAADAEVRERQAGRASSGPPPSGACCTRPPPRPGS